MHPYCPNCQAYKPACDCPQPKAPNEFENIKALQAQLAAVDMLTVGKDFAHDVLDAQRALAKLKPYF